MTPGQGTEATAQIADARRRAQALADARPDEPAGAGGPSWRDPMPSVWMAAALLAAIAAVITWTTREVYDDPWILYRYAENLAAGDGWTFNPEAVSENAVTSPLTVLLLAAALAVGLPLGFASAALFALGTWVAAMGAYATLRRLGHPLAGLATGVLLLTAPPLTSLRGMETSTYLALLAAAAFCLVAGRAGSLGVVLGLAVLARPDAALFAVAAVLWLLLSTRSVPWRTLLGAAGVLLPWTVAAIPLTGGILPSTLAAKQAQATSGAWPGYLRGLADLPFDPGMTTWFALAVGLALIGLPAAVRDCRPVLVPLVAATGALAVAYGLVLGIASYPWYAALPVFTLSWFAGLGVERAVELVRVDAARAALLGAVLAVAGVAASQAPGMDAARVQYEEVGDWLAENAPEGSLVAAAEIGRIGFFADRTVVDYLGLLDQQANEHVAAADWTWWLDEYRPDHWVTFRPDRPGGTWSVERSTREDPQFDALYRPVLQTADLIVYERITR